MSISNPAQNQKAFLYQMAQNTLLFKVPIDFFGKLSVESGGEHPNTFNIKHAMAQVVGFARVYAIYYGLESTNTLQRINRLHEIRGAEKCCAPGDCRGLQLPDAAPSQAPGQTTRHWCMSRTIMSMPMS